MVKVYQVLVKTTWLVEAIPQDSSFLTCTVPSQQIDPGFGIPGENYVNSAGCIVVALAIPISPGLSITNPCYSPLSTRQTRASKLRHCKTLVIFTIAICQLVGFIPLKPAAPMLVAPLLYHQLFATPLLYQPCMAGSCCQWPSLSTMKRQLTIRQSLIHPFIIVAGC